MRLLLSDLAAPRGYLVAANCCHLGGFSGGRADVLAWILVGGGWGGGGGEANEVSR